MKSKDLQGRGKKNNETMGRKKTVNRKNQKSRIPTEPEQATSKPQWMVGSLDFNLLDENEERIEVLAGTTEPVEDEISTLASPSAFMKAAHNMSESSSSGKVETTTKKLLTESPRRRNLEGRGQVPFL